MSYGVVFSASAVVIVVSMVATWRVSLRVGRADIVDIAWGLGFVLVAWTTWLLADGTPVRRHLLAVMPTLWGLRLGGFLAARNLRRPEDRRYAAMRRRLGDERFARISLWSVFLFQGLLMWIVSLPVQIGQLPDQPQALTLGGVVGVVVWAVGMVFETVGDWQLERFKSAPANRDRIMDQGLWRYTRHPNYFGDFCVWWGIFMVAATTPVGFASVPGPLLMSVLLLRVSGVRLTERTMFRRPGYAEYAERTNTFFPGPPATRPEPRWPA